MYDLADHRTMVSDEVRVDAYARAITAVVVPGDVVLDLGCGIGIFSVLAARAGARRVYAVDETDVVHYARRVAAENGVGGAVEAIRGLVERVTLAERPTVVVGDVRGPLPLDAGGIAAWEAASRLLAPGGRTIPRRDVVYAQPIASDALFRHVHAFGPVQGVAFESLRGPLANHRHEEPPDVTEVLPERPVFEVRYGSPLPSRLAGSAEWTAAGPLSVDGFRIGFEADLAPGISYRSFGAGRARPYGVHVLPTPGRISLAAGGRLRLRLVSDLLEDASPLSWAVDVGAGEGHWQGPLLETGQSLDVLRAGLPDHVPAADAADDLDALVLAAFRDGRSVGETVAAARAALPASSAAMIERRVAELSRRRQARVVRRLGTR